MPKTLNFEDPIDVAKNQRFAAIQKVRELDLQIRQLKDENQKLKAENRIHRTVAGIIAEDHPELVAGAVEVAKARENIQQAVLAARRQAKTRPESTPQMRQAHEVTP